MNSLPKQNRYRQTLRACNLLLCILLLCSCNSTKKDSESPTPYSDYYRQMPQIYVVPPTLDPNITQKNSTPLLQKPKVVRELSPKVKEFVAEKFPTLYARYQMITDNIAKTNLELAELEKTYKGLRDESAKKLVYTKCEELRERRNKLLEARNKLNEEFEYMMAMYKVKSDPNVTNKVENILNDTEFLLKEASKSQTQILK